jgi:hypothetical protein
VYSLRNHLCLSKVLTLIFLEGFHVDLVQDRVDSIYSGFVCNGYVSELNGWLELSLVGSRQLGLGLEFELR